MATSDQPTKATLLAGTAERLARLFPGADVAAFATELFRNGSAEDLAVYSEDMLADVARTAWDRLQARTPGTHRISVTAMPAADLTVVEVANDDMPFLLDSVLGELTASGCELRLVLHPILTVARAADGQLARFIAASSRSANDPEQRRESLIHIHVAQVSPEAQAALQAALDQTLTDVRRAVTDWQPMLSTLQRALDDLQGRLGADAPASRLEALEFLKWLRDDNFIFLGMRTYRSVGEASDIGLERVPDTGLGVLVDPLARVLSRGADDLNSSAAVADFLKSDRDLTITKSSLQSRVHRRALMDYVGLKLADAQGTLQGELRMVGLFTSTAYTQPVRGIPLVRHKVDDVITRAGFDPRSHSGKALINVLEHHPRDDMFQIDADTLLEFSSRILALDEHPRLRVLARRDPFDRFVSVLVYVPRDRYTTDVRVRIGEYLEQALDGSVTTFQPAFPEGMLSRVHLIVSRTGGVTPMIDETALEEAIAEIIRTWSDRLATALRRDRDHATADRLLTYYESAFGGAYREAYGAEIAAADITTIEIMAGQAHQPVQGPVIDFYRPDQAPATGLSLKLFHPVSPINLSDRVPVLENIGLRVIDERTYRIEPVGGSPVFLHDMTLQRADGAGFDFTRDIDQRLSQLFSAVWAGRAENDGFNALVMTAGLDWREIAVLRAYSRYLRQIGVPYSQDYMWGAVGRFPAIAALLVELFVNRFDPDFAPETDRAAGEAAILAGIETALGDVASLDDDAILRRFVNVITATIRTDWFRAGPGNAPRDTVAFKLDSHKLTALPEPKPFREIWVYGARVEGIHTRFGKVARGGLRWSDRAQDFRTEVLGLVKAQQVKNAVIVPVGAKGGFLPKGLKPGMSRDAWFREGTAAYEIFVGSLLSVTDNIEGNAVVPPPRVVRHEPDDPYLVVAADKGTATFSDTANVIAEQAGFWLGDAFASGGSAGYDHKKMGITARGAFEAVKRHFREMDVNILATPFSVVGVGDMSGDVFGNGMLLAPTIRLIAAFDHRDIFIDPAPDMAASLAERRRLFNLPRSSWADYDRALISPGGGVFSRAAKSIDLGPEARAALGLDAAHPTPLEVMRAILKADVDLLWFGGIGTYIRAITETNEAAGDRANDAIRVTAREIRAKVIGEGANLGVTQRARIEFNLAGGRCNSDAIDNSAGVNSSDVEVNVKIAFGNAIRTGQIDRPTRDRIMAEMTDAVAAIVLRNNYLQTLAISVSAHRGAEEFGQQRRLIRALETSGRLDRVVEVIPDEATLDQRGRSGVGLTRAEIGVLLAYAKLAIKDELLAGDVPDDAALAETLVTYFPARMRNDFGDAIRAHRLKREIVATTLVNAMVDHGGPTLVTRVASQTDGDTATVARAFVVAREIHAVMPLLATLDALDSVIAGKLQLDLYVRVQDLLIGSVTWLTRSASFSDGIGTVVERFGPAIAQIGPQLPALLPRGLAEAPRQEIERLTAAGVPDDLAIRLAHLPLEAAICDIVLVAEASGQDLAMAADAYFAVADRFRIARLERLALAIPIADYYDGLALDRARGQLADAHRAIARVALGVAGGLESWAAARNGEVARVLDRIAELADAERLTVSRFAVAAGLMGDLARD